MHHILGTERGSGRNWDLRPPSPPRIKGVERDLSLDTGIMHRMRARRDSTQKATCLHAQLRLSLLTCVAALSMMSKCVTNAVDLESFEEPSQVIRSQQDDSRHIWSLRVFGT